MYFSVWHNFRFFSVIRPARPQKISACVSAREMSRSRLLCLASQGPRPSMILAQSCSPINPHTHATRTHCVKHTHTHTHTHTPEQSFPSAVRFPPQELRWSHSQFEPKYSSVKFICRCMYYTETVTTVKKQSTHHNGPTVISTNTASLPLCNSSLEPQFNSLLHTTSIVHTLYQRTVARRSSWTKHLQVSQSHTPL